MHDYGNRSAQLDRIEANQEIMAATLQAVVAKLNAILQSGSRQIDPEPIRATTPLSECETDCLVVLSECNYRPTTDEMLRELAGRGLIHGDITIKRALARLVKLEYCEPGNAKHRGYQITDPGSQAVTQLLAG